MFLTQTAEYALRATMALALLPEGHLLTATQLAERTDVPLPYLSKILRKLVVAELLLAQKGHHGGFRLARAPGAITFAQILDAVGCPIQTTHCAFGAASCNPHAPCPLHVPWSRLTEAANAWANHHTLARPHVFPPAGPAERNRPDTPPDPPEPITPARPLQSEASSD